MLYIASIFRPSCDAPSGFALFLGASAAATPFSTGERARQAATGTGRPGRHHLPGGEGDARREPGWPARLPFAGGRRTGGRGLPVPLGRRAPLVFRL